MIYDLIVNFHSYVPLHKGFEEADRFFMQPDIRELPIGKYEIDGDRVFALVSREHGRRKEDAALEAHQKYIDIQLVLSGSDDMGWKSKSLCKEPAGEYEESSDVQFFTDEPESWITVNSGAFAVFFPEDAHMPLISPGRIHKIVVKVKV